MSSSERRELVIANLYHCCYHDIEGLIDFLSNRRAAGNLASDPDQAREQLGRLKIWNEEVKAQSGELDHYLRRDLQLRINVAELLYRLIGAIEKGESLEGGQFFV
jgi:hypothetical protein